MHNFSIDINVDVGEGVENEAQLMPYISSCNIACSGHAGDETTMKTVVKLAKQFGVKIGAHPSFPDKEHFGRKPMDMSCAALFSSLKNQIESLQHILKIEQANLHHIKPHGALYNLAASNEKTALVIVEVMKSFALPINLYVPYQSVIANVAIQNNIPIIYEAFADRNYNDDYSLVSRSKSHALITNKEEVFEHVYSMIFQHNIICENGRKIDCNANTFCLHSDTPNSIEILQYLTYKFQENNLKIKKG